MNLNYNTELILVLKGFLYVAQQPNSGLDRLIVEVSRSHTIRHAKQ